MYNLFPANAIIAVRKKSRPVDILQAGFWCVLIAEGEKHGLLWQNDHASRIWKMCMQSTGARHTAVKRLSASSTLCHIHILVQPVHSNLSAIRALRPNRITLTSQEKKLRFGKTLTLHDCSCHGVWQNASYRVFHGFSLPRWPWPWIKVA